MTPTNEQSERAPGVRPTIGLLTASVLGFWKRPWLGVVDAARARGANVICFSGAVINTSQIDRQRNALYNLVDSKRIDGLIVWSSAIDGAIGGEGMQRFCQRFHPLPLVCAERKLDGIPSLLMDDYAGARATINHLIEHHGYRRIAFISGAKNHAGARERYRAYTEALADHGLPFDPDLVVPPTSLWIEDESKAVFTEWLDTRAPRFDALMSVNDAYMFHALQILEARGIPVPDQVAAAGFDAQDEGASMIVPLTTVQPPFYELGYLATEMVLDMIAGRSVPSEITLPTKLVIRQSCGCFGSAAIGAVAGAADMAHSNAGASALVPDREPEAEADQLARLIAEHKLLITPDDAQHILDAVLVEVQGQANDQLLLTLNRLLRQASIDKVRIDWYRVIATLRQHLLAQLTEPELVRRAEDIWLQAQVLIAHSEQRTEMRHGWQRQQQATAFRHLGQSLITTFDVAELMNVVAEELPGLDIRRCYLSLYEGLEQPAAQARLMLAYDEHGRATLPVEGRLFLAHELMPQELWHPDATYNLIVEALYFQEQQLGFVIFEADLREDWVYESLRGELSSSLKGALLVAQEERRSAQLQTIAEMGALLPAIVKPDMLLQSVADGIKTNFDLYHANVYLLNESGDTLALVAGTGELGRALLAQGHTIALDSNQTLVAHAARTRQVVTIKDVQLQPDISINPLLPLTRSQIAVPLLLGEQLLGVLEASSIHGNTFTSTDRSVQHTFARQVAAALRNAQLYQALERQTMVAEDARRTAEEANAFKSQFLANISHELRTPLNAILNFTRFIGANRYGVLNDRQVDLQQRILTNAEHLLGLINDILDLSKLEAAHVELFREPVDLCMLLDEVMAIAIVLTQAKGLDVTLDCSGELPLVWIDKKRVHQVLLNLLSNAAKFTERGSITLRVVHVGDMVQLAVQDTGIGIAPEHQALIFEEFRQVQAASTRQYQGTGLGLAISRKLIELHGGRIWLDSTLHVGSTFYCTVPVYREG